MCLLPEISLTQGGFSAFKRFTIQSKPNHNQTAVHGVVRPYVASKCLILFCERLIWEKEISPGSSATILRISSTRPLQCYPYPPWWACWYDARPTSDLLCMHRVPPGGCYLMWTAACMLWRWALHYDISEPCHPLSRLLTGWNTHRSWVLSSVDEEVPTEAHVSSCRLSE